MRTHKYDGSDGPDCCYMEQGGGVVCGLNQDALVHRTPDEITEAEVKAAQHLESLGYEEVTEPEMSEGESAIHQLFSADKKTPGFITYQAKDHGGNISVWPVTVAPYEEPKPKRVQIVVAFTDGELGYFPVDNDQGWKVRRGEIVVGKGLGRTHIPLSGVKYYMPQEY